MQESFCLPTNHLEVGHLGLQLPALSFLSFPSSSRSHIHTHTRVFCLTTKLTALPRAHPSPGALDINQPPKIRCRWECSVPRGVPFSRDQDYLATSGGTLPHPLGDSLPSTALRASSLKSTSLPLRWRASPLALCVYARGQARMAFVPLWVEAVA